MNDTLDGFNLQSVRETLGEPIVEDVSVLNWVRCMGHSEVDTTFTDPRTNETRTVPRGQVHYMLTTYHYGSNAVWYFGSTRLPQSLSETWRSDIKEMQKDEEAIFVIKRRIETWEPKTVKFLAFGDHRYELPDFEYGIRLIESLDRQETVSFLPLSLQDCGNTFLCELFPSYYFSKRFDRNHPECKRFVPEVLLK
jgi:hypothetical protein